MSESKIYTIPDGNNSLDPNLMLALSQNGGFGNNGNWMWMMFMWILFPWIFNGNGLKMVLEVTMELVSQLIS